MDIKIAAAIVKCVIEHGDGTQYFGSTLEYRRWQREAIAEGLITVDASGEERATTRGRDWCKTSLQSLPRCGLTFWNDSQIESFKNL